MITLCKTCGTAYDARPDRCPICEDERQYVPATGQAWTDFDTVTATHTNKWQQLEPQLFSIKTVPAFAINQRALLLRTDATPDEQRRIAAILARAFPA